MSRETFKVNYRQRIDALYEQMKDAPKREQERLMRTIQALERSKE